MTCDTTRHSATDSTDRDLRARTDEVVPVAQEVLHLGRRKVDLGGVRVDIRTERDQQQLPVELTRQDVDIRRVPVDRVVDCAPDIVERGDVTIIPVLVERPVLRTELVLVEEIHVIRRRDTSVLQIPVTLRRQVADLSRIDPADAVGDPETAGKNGFEIKDDDNDL